MNWTPFYLETQYRDYIWGGGRLRPGISPTAEAWIVHAENQIASGPLKGLTLEQASQKYGAELLGTRVAEYVKGQFPLLIKLLDCKQWLSLQVHPDDEGAVKLEGPDAVGKTEAWYFLDADPGSQILAGLKPGASLAQFSAAVGSSSVLECVQYLDVHSGDFVYIPAGTIHALGPGLLVYEIQQNSNITYRVYDWDRPLSSGRVLHVEQSRASARSNGQVQAVSTVDISENAFHSLAACPYFRLSMLKMNHSVQTLPSNSETFSVLTVAAGSVQVEYAGQTLPLNALETLFIPAACGAVLIHSEGEAQILHASG